MDLSAADADKWPNLIKREAWKPDEVSPTPPDYEPRREIRQAQARFTPERAARLVERYRTGTSATELATEFGCCRATVIEHLKRAGIPLRLPRVTPEQVDELVRLYESGLSMAKVAEQIGVDPSSVMNHLRKRGVKTRDAHGRERQA